MVTVFDTNVITGEMVVVDLDVGDVAAGALAIKPELFHRIDKRVVMNRDIAPGIGGIVGEVDIMQGA